MRHTFPIAALLSLLLAACTSAPKAPVKAVDQSGPLKVHPGLLGQPVPPELQPLEAPAPKAAPAPAAPAAEEGPRGKADDGKQQAERSVYFDLNSAAVKPEFAAGLQAHAERLTQRPQARVRIEGNADERGPTDHNRKLGLKRAESVKQFLVDRGVAGKQVKVISLGSSNPRRKGHDEESWAENRRADIVYEKED